jgi:hypothetical protein
MLRKEEEELCLRERTVFKEGHNFNFDFLRL